MPRTILRTAAAALAGVLLPLMAPSAALAAPAAHDALVVDFLAPGDGSAANATYDSSGSSVPVAAPSTVFGGVRINRPSSASSGPGIEVLPADGAPLAVGRYDRISGQWASGARPLPVVRLIGNIGTCTSFASANPAPAASLGWLDVTAVAFDGGGVVTTLAATFSILCASSSGVTTGVIRYHSDESYVSVSPHVTSLSPVNAGSHTPVTATITNRGTVPVSLGVPTQVAHGSDKPSLHLTEAGENCSQAPLAVGASCTANLEFVADGTYGGGDYAEMRLVAPATIRGFVEILVRAPSINFPPRAPTSVLGDEAYDGVRVRWFRDTNGPMADGFRVRRVDGAEPVLLGTVSWAEDVWVDTTLAKGETATYEVAAYNAAGETPGARVTLTRPDLPDPPAAVAHNALVAHDDVGAKVADSAKGADVKTFRTWLLAVTIEGPMSSPSISTTRLPHVPGTYPVGSDPGQVRVMSTRSPGTFCSWPTGTVVVREAWMKADLTPYRVDADFHLLCGSTPIEFQVRIGTDAPYAALETTGGLTAFQAVVGATPDVRTLTLDNVGGHALSIGTPTLTGNDASSFSIASNNCPATLPAGQSCAFGVRFAPTRSMAHFAALGFSAGAAGGRTVPVGGSAIGPPPATALTAQPLLGRTYLSWSSNLPDGGSPITGFSVQRAGPTGIFTEIKHLGGGALSYVDAATVTGSTYGYRVLVENQYGSTTAGVPVATVTMPVEELVVSIPNYSALKADLASVPVGTGRALRYETGQDTDEPAVSPDGRWIAYVVYDTDGNSDVWLRAVDGSVASRALAARTGVDELHPAWSPDSATVAFTNVVGSAVSVGRVAIAPGSTPSPFPNSDGAYQPSWLPDGSGIVAGAFGALVRISTTGTRTAIAGTQPNAWQPRVSPRGDLIAYVTTDSNLVDHLWVLPVAGGTSRSVVEDRDSYLDRPVWAPDGGAVVVNKLSYYGSSDVVLWRPGHGAGDTIESFSVAGGEDVFGLGWRREDVAAPVITFPSAPARTASAARIPVRVTDDTVPVGGLKVTCRVDGKEVPRCSGGYAGTLPAGAHTLSVTATDPHGKTTAASYAWTVDAAPPSLSVKALPSFTTGSSVVFGYAGSDPSGVASYDVRYRRAAWNATGFAAYSSPTGWLATRALSRSIAVTPGTEYCFSVRARDSVGNVSTWSGDRCTAAPLDDRSLRRVSGAWSSLSASSAYRGTLTRAVRGGAVLDRSGVRVKRLVLVATTCPTCGSVDVYLGTTRLARVSLVSRTTVAKRQLALPVRAAVTAGTVRLTTVSGAQVRIDGLGLRRT